MHPLHKIALPKTGRRQRAKSSITLPRIVRFRSNLYKVLSRDPRSITEIQVRGQRSRLRREVMTVKIC